MGNLATILALGALIIGSIVLWNARRHTAAAQDQSSAYAVERLAREAAQVGLQDVLRELNDEVGAWPSTLAGAQTRYNVGTTTHGSGTYTVTVDQMVLGPTDSDPDQIWLTAVGTHDGYDASTGTTGTTTMTLRTVYETDLEDIGLPPAMRQAVQTDDNLVIKGNGCISGATHSNGTTSTSGNTFDVLGTGSATGGTSTTAAGEGRFKGGLIADADSIDIPIVTIPPTGITSTQGTAGTTFTLDASNDAYTAGGTTTVFQGWFGVAGRGNDVANNQYVLYVPGNLEVNGDVRLVGYSQIFVAGTLTINGNASISPVDPSVPWPAVSASMSCGDRMAVLNTWANANLPNGQSTLGIYTGGNIVLGGNINVVAHLWSNAAVVYSGGGNPDRLIIGGITAQNDLELKGTTMIYYTEAGETITPGGTATGYDGLVLTGYNEHADRP